MTQIAIGIDFTDIPLVEQRDRLRPALNRFRHRDSLHRLVDTLFTIAGEQAAELGAPGAIVAPILLSSLNEFLMHRMVHGIWPARITWRRALPWFGHQDMGLHDDPEKVLIRLSSNARSDDAEARRAIDDLLLSAFLADLRECAARARGRRPRVLVLLDDGDAPSSRAFLGSLLRTRRSLTAARVPRIDPLTVIATSSSLLAQHLAGELSIPPVSPDIPDADEIDSTAQRWLRLGLPELSGVEVENLARHVDSVTPLRISGPVHRLTGGHPASTCAVLERVRDEPGLVDDLESVLRGPGPAPSPTFREYLLRPFVRALSPHRSVDSELGEALVTVSAARDKREAKLLLPFLPDGIDQESVLFESPSLWTTGPDESETTLPLVVRMLGLRILAARTDPAYGWDMIVGHLHDETGDHVAKLYYRRLLRGSAAIVNDLLHALRESPTEQWLADFDRIVSVFDPRRTDQALLAEADHGTDPAYRLTVLLAATSAYQFDPLITTRAQKARLCHRIEASYQALAALAEDGDLLRARHALFDKLATQFS